MHGALLFNVSTEVRKYTSNTCCIAFQDQRADLAAVTCILIHLFCSFLYCKGMVSKGDVRNPWYCLYKHQADLASSFRRLLLPPLPSSTARRNDFKSERCARRIMQSLDLFSLQVPYHLQGPRESARQGAGNLRLLLLLLQEMRSH